MKLLISYDCLKDDPELLALDLYGKTLQYRCKHWQKEPLMKACGLNKNPAQTVVDGTAGFGQDSLILLSSGATVCMVERSPRLVPWLAYLASTQERLSFIPKDTCLFLAKHTSPIDILYLDPMFPDKKSSAKNQKKMAFLQALLGTPLDQNCLFSAALESTAKRIVVKRPKHAPFLGTQRPTFSHLYRSCRFDVYLKP